MIRIQSLCLAMASLALPVFSGCASQPTLSISQSTTHLGLAPGASLSEDEPDAEVLGKALTRFLDSLQRGELGDGHTDPGERERYAFYYQSLLRGAQNAEPVVLKSYPVDGGGYMITLAFMTGMPDELRISRIVELEARPVRRSFQFQCPYERNTAQLQRRTIGDVTYRFRGPFDEQRAAGFVRIKARLEVLQGRESQPLQYDCFQSLQGLLKAYGLVHDASKCNFLLHDLGFLWHGGQRYATGTGDESYLFGYVRGALSAGTTDPGTIYKPYLNGVAAYYGGYALSGDSMEVLADQFRGELQRRPTIDFLEEFKKGRASSVHRHFSHYVMCAFLCQAIVERHGESAALRLIESGSAGVHFFPQLRSLLGVTEANFHATIVRLIGIQR